MKRLFLKWTLALTLALLAIGLAIPAKQIDEAPAGFDGLTNGYLSQNDMDKDVGIFSEIRTPEQGLGPIYNAVSCTDCHQNIAVGGAAQNMEFRAGHSSQGEHAHDGYFNGYRRQSDDNGSSPTFTAATAILGNGDTIPDRSLINQRAICADAQERVGPNDNVHAARLSLSVLGDGFVEAVPDSTFLALAKRNHGEAILVPVLEVPNTMEVGRFGWKDQNASLLTFAGDAFFNEMGMTNALFPDEVTTVCQPSGVPEPNDTQDDIQTFADFMRSTKVPPRGPITPDVLQGQLIFEQIGCSSCHAETLVTAPAGTVIHGGAYVIPPALGGKEFHPFGDYLLHDIGTGDGIQQNGPADTINKVRTMPLWGLRTRTQMMHNASMGSFDDAIGLHRNEAADEALRFRRLTPAQKALVYKFLESL
ncbi:MAG: di-heme oxidoredictase family protein [Candidatus Acidiferrales bacterium]